jgi:hypothetical protein
MNDKLQFFSIFKYENTLFVSHLNKRRKADWIDHRRIPAARTSVYVLVIVGWGPDQRTTPEIQEHTYDSHSVLLRLVRITELMQEVFFFAPRLVVVLNNTVPNSLWWSCALLSLEDALKSDDYMTIK